MKMVTSYSWKLRKVVSNCNAHAQFWKNIWKTSRKPLFCQYIQQIYFSHLNQLVTNHNKYNNSWPEKTIHPRLFEAINNTTTVAKIIYLALVSKQMSFLCLYLCSNYWWRFYAFISPRSLSPINIGRKFWSCYHA